MTLNYKLQKLWISIPKFFNTTVQQSLHIFHTKFYGNPVQHKVQNIPLAVRPALAKKLQSLQDKGYIEPIDASEWVSLIVVAHKPDGRVQLCIDLRDVNSKIIIERYPMPNIYGMLSRLESAKVFSTIDLSISAYHRRVKRHYCVHYFRRSFSLYANTLRSCVLVICVITMHKIFKEES